MKAVLVVPAQEPTACPSVPCPVLFPVLDRPFLQHVVEALALRGVTQVEVVLGPGAEAVERFLGDGGRWGCEFSYHLLADPERPANVLRAAGLGPVLLARADYLPVLPPELPDPPVLFGTPGDWSGWAVIDGGELADVADVPPATLAHRLALDGATWADAGRPVVLRSLADVPEAQRRFLLGVPGTLVSAREERPGVWLGRGTQVSPAATLEPPVFVADGTAIGPGVRLGPFAVVGPDCVLDRDSAAEAATVCAGTYVGPGVELAGVIVDGPTVVNPRRGTSAATDRWLLDHLTPAGPLGDWPGRALAAAAFAFALPVVLAAAIWTRLTRPGPVFYRRRFARADGSGVGTVYTLAPPRPGEAERGWVIPATFRGLVLELLPALGCVAWGGLRLVGVPPRTAGPFPIPPGLVTEAALCGADRLPPEDHELIDAYQAQTTGLLPDLRRVGRFLLRALTTWGRPPVAAATAG